MAVALPAAGVAQPTLRPYQSEAVAKTIAAIGQGERSQLGVAATGLGKTVVVAALARDLDCRTLILAHRDELISQAVKKVREWWPGVDIGIMQGPNSHHWKSVVVASVQTVSRDLRLATLLAAHELEPFGLVVVDEAHHAVAASYAKVLDALAAGTTAGPVLLGVTATGSRKGLGDRFKTIPWTYDIEWGIRAGFLSDLVGRSVALEVNLDDVRSRGGDYVDGDLGRVLVQADAPTHVADAWAREASDRRSTLAFCPTIELAQQTAQEFRARGVEAASVSGVDIDERRLILRRFHEGTLRVVTNCAVLTEGYDEARIDCVVVARPTRSQDLYVQMVGRGTRLYPEKADCMVLDVVGASKAHSLVTLAKLFGLAPKALASGGSVGAALKAREAADLAAGRLRSEEVDLFRRMREAKLGWIKHGAAFAANVGDETVVLEGSGERWFVKIIPRSGKPRYLAAAVGLERAQGVGDDYVRQNKPANLRNPKAAWRSRPPSEKAMDMAYKWHIRVDPKWTAGDLSDAIDERIAAARLRQGRRKR